MDLFCSVPDEKVEDLAASVLECDYDNDPSNLYQAIESEAWVPVLQFLETGKWDHIMFQKDRHSPERQARTWVTRFEKDGSVRWSQLPLHAAIIFGAPKKIIAALLDLYPLGIRCTDDQQMLPLHLAFRFGADDNVLIFLLERFPEALFTKNVRGRVPTEIDGPRKELTALIQKIIGVTTENVSAKQGEFYQEQMADLRDDLNLQSKLNADLEVEKAEMEKKLSRINTELIMLQNEYRMLVEKNNALEAENSSKLPNVSFKNSGPLEPLPSFTKFQDLGLDPSATIDTFDSSMAMKPNATKSFVFGRAKSNPKSMTTKPSAGTPYETRTDIETNRKSRDGGDSSTRRVASTDNTKNDARSSSKNQGKWFSASLKPRPETIKDKPRPEKRSDAGEKDTIDNGMSQPQPSSVQSEKASVGSKASTESKKSADSKTSKESKVSNGSKASKESKASTVKTTNAPQSAVSDQVGTKVVNTAKEKEKQKTLVPVPHPGTRLRLPRHGFFQGFGTLE